jgi:hypothetical protein
VTTCEARSALAERRLCLILQLIPVRTGVVEECVTLEVVFLRVIARTKRHGQRPNDTLLVRSLGTTRLLVNEAPLLVVPTSNMVPEAPARFIREINQDGRDANQDWRPIVRPVATTSEVVFVDNWPLEHPLGAENKIERFADG